MLLQATSETAFASESSCGAQGCGAQGCGSQGCFNAREAVQRGCPIPPNPHHSAASGQDEDTGAERCGSAGDTAGDGGARAAAARAHGVRAAHAHGGRGELSDCAAHSNALSCGVGRTSDAFLATSASRGLELSCQPCPQPHGASAAHAVSAGAGSEWGSASAQTLQREKQRRLVALGFFSPRQDKAACDACAEGVDTHGGGGGAPFDLVPLQLDDTPRKPLRRHAPPDDTPRKPLKRPWHDGPNPHPGAHAPRHAGTDLLAVAMEGLREQAGEQEQAGQFQQDGMLVGAGSKEGLPRAAAEHQGPSAAQASQAAASPSALLSGDVRDMHL